MSPLAARPPAVCSDAGKQQRSHCWPAALDSLHQALSRGAGGHGGQGSRLGGCLLDRGIVVGGCHVGRGRGGGGCLLQLLVVQNQANAAQEGVWAGALGPSVCASSAEMHALQLAQLCHSSGAVQGQQGAAAAQQRAALQEGGSTEVWGELSTAGDWGTAGCVMSGPSGSCNSLRQCKR